MNERIAMVGAGYWAQFQLEGWRDAGAPVVALCNRSAANAAPLAARFGVPQCFTSLTDMLDAVQPTLLDVVLPPEVQQGAVRAALERGIPTICQKPFGANLAQARAMTALAQQHATPLVVHENFRFAPWFRECRRLIDSGFFGRVHGITFRLRPGDGQGPQAYLERQPYFQAMPQFLVRETAVHFIDTFRYLLGEVEAVTARLRRLNPVIAGEDSGLIVFEFGDARSGLFDGNRLNDHVADNPRRTMGEMWLEGERGVLRLDGQARLWFKPHHGAEIEHRYGGTRPGAFGGACTALQTHVLAHLREGAALENAAADYLANLHVQAAIYESHTTGMRVVMSRFTPQDDTDWRLI
jgi:predicted dehydrogenase